MVIKFEKSKSVQDEDELYKQFERIKNRELEELMCKKVIEQTKDRFNNIVNELEDWARRQNSTDVLTFGK